MCSNRVCVHVHVLLVCLCARTCLCSKCACAHVHAWAAYPRGHRAISHTPQHLAQVQERQAALVDAKSGSTLRVHLGSSSGGSGSSNTEGSNPEQQQQHVYSPLLSVLSQHLPALAFPERCAHRKVLSGAFARASPTKVQACQGLLPMPHHTTRVGLSGAFTRASSAQEQACQGLLLVPRQHKRRPFKGFCSCLVSSRAGLSGAFACASSPQGQACQGLLLVPCHTTRAGWQRCCQAMRQCSPFYSPGSSSSCCSSASSTPAGSREDLQGPLTWPDRP